MQRIGTSDGLFHDGDPFNNVQGTMMTSAWANSVQEEIAHVIEVAGLTLDPAQSGQLYTAIEDLIIAYVTMAISSAMTTAGTEKYVNGNATLTAGTYQVDSSAGPFTLDFPANPTSFMSVTLVDATASWGTNPVTLDFHGKNFAVPNGAPLAGPLVCNVSDQKFTVWWDNTAGYWRLI